MPTNGANGTDRLVSRPLAPGIYAPIPTFFLPETEDLGKCTVQDLSVKLNYIDKIITNE